MNKPYFNVEHSFLFTYKNMPRLMEKWVGYQVEMTLFGPPLLMVLFGIGKSLYSFLYYSVLISVVQRLIIQREKERGGGQWAIFYTSPKYLFLICWLNWTTLRTFSEFWLVVSLSWVSNHFKERIIWCIIIGNVHKFIRHCRIPLDPWKYFLFRIC